MIRGTTPTVEFDVDIDLTSATVLYLTFMQNEETVIEKTLSDLTITADSVSCRLSQEDTLTFDYLKALEMQFRGIVDGEAVASNIMKTLVGRILKQGVI